MLLERQENWVLTFMMEKAVKKLGDQSCKEGLCDQYCENLSSIHENLHLSK